MYCKFPFSTHIQPNVPIRIVGIQDAHRNDVNPQYVVGSIFGHDDHVFVLRDLVEVREGVVEPLVLDIPAERISNLPPQSPTGHGSSISARTRDRHAVKKYST
ncbi:hypothetical protein KIPB_013627, partial [Kipferlia bialata]|eukprot:g13627.t1